MQVIDLLGQTLVPANFLYLCDGYATFFSIPDKAGRIVARDKRASIYIYNSQGEDLSPLDV